MAFLANIRRFHRNNVETLRRSPLAEISGAFGDLGTLLPLMITLAVNGSISLSTTLVFSGIFNLVTGVVFGIPLPVQPMKVNPNSSRGFFFFLTRSRYHPPGRAHTVTLLWTGHSAPLSLLFPPFSIAWLVENRHAAT